MNARKKCVLKAFLKIFRVFRNFFSLCSNHTILDKRSDQFMWYNWPKTFLVLAYSSWILFLSWFHITVSFLISARLKEYICYSLDYLGCTDIFSYVFFLVVACLSNCSTNGENMKREERKWIIRLVESLFSLTKNQNHWLVDTHIDTRHRDIHIVVATRDHFWICIRFYALHFSLRFQQTPATIV